MTSPASRAWYLPMCVSRARPLQSPTAYSHPPATPTARSWSSTSTYRPGSSPTVSSPSDVVAGRRPTATRISSASSSRPSARVATTGPSEPLPPRGGHGDAGDDGDALGLERRGELVAGEGLLPTEEPIAALDHRDLLAAEAPERLGHLGADGAAAQHQQPARQLLGRRDRAVVPRRDVPQPRDRRDRGAGAGGEHDRRWSRRAGAVPPSAQVDLDLRSCRPAGHCRAPARCPCSSSQGDLAGVVPVAGHVVALGEGGGDVDRRR